MHGINNVWQLPGYRFGALVVAHLKDDKMPEGIATIDDTLLDADLVPHPFFDPKFRQTVLVMGRVLSSTPYIATSSTTVGNVIYDPRLAELPIEEKKRQEAAAAGKAFRVPDWWVGERKAYKVAQTMMKTLPKKMGPIK